METLNGADIMTFEDAAQWESWLAGHYQLQAGVWLKLAKKGSGIASVTLAEALDVALCYGWIDNIRKSYDGSYYLQKYTPRRPKGLWSKVNIGKVEALVAAGRMQDPGRLEILAAQADGRWAAAYESQKDAVVPPDLVAALEANKRARDFFESLGKASRYSVIFRLMTARTPEVYAARFQKIMAMLEAGEKF